MFEKVEFKNSLAKNYSLLNKQLEALIKDEPNMVANLANASALLNYFLTDINWVGFYLVDERKNELVLGPFNGLPACVRIPLGRGVCGSSAQELTTYNINNVHEFPGHIACDSASNSEIVIPIIKNDKLIGVLDIDSPIFNRFTKEEQAHLEEYVKIIVESL